MMTDAYSFDINDLVWAKMKGFSPWPGMVVDPPAHMSKGPTKKNIPSKCIYFFGTRNYAWIETANLKPYQEFKEELSKTSKSATFKEALEHVESYLKDPTILEIETLPQENDNDADFDKLRESDEINSGDYLVDKTPPTKKPPKFKSKSLSAKSTKSAKKNLNNNTTPSSVKRKRNSQHDTGSTRKKLNTNFDFLTPSTARRSTNATTLLNRPTVTRPEAPVIDMQTSTNDFSTRDITPSELTFGFLGLGIMGSTFVKNFIYTGHKVVVWNRTATKCEPFAAAGAEVKQTPSEVVDSADITFCCVSDPKAAKDLVFGNCGVLQATTLSLGKGYVEMSTIDPETSQDIAEGIVGGGGRYLEAQIQGTRPEAEQGNVVLLAGGERSVFDECESCFKSIAKNTFFLGETGNACKVNLILQTIVGVSLVGLSEALALADRFSISLKDIMDILELTSIKSGLLLAKGREMAKGEFNPQHALGHMQKDLRLVLDMAETVDQAMPTASISNEVFKHAKRLGYSDHDSSAVYVRARF